MALSDEQLAYISEITLESLESVVALVAEADFTPEQESLISDDIDTWEAIRNSYVRFKGDGVDFDNERKREAIRQRMRKMLGLSLVPFETYPTTLVISHTANW
jgi:hypothetical protein